MTDEPRFLMLHAEYEARNPDDAAVERQYTRRDVPCPGSLRAAGDGEMLLVTCSRCRFETTVRADRLPATGIPF